MESEELGVESLRRQQVAQVKLAGWFIEWIESQRSKLKEKKKIGQLMNLLQRITNLRAQVTTLYLSICEIEEEKLIRISPIKRTRIIPAIEKIVLVSLIRECSLKSQCFVSFLQNTLLQTNVPKKSFM